MFFSIEWLRPRLAPLPRRALRRDLRALAAAAIACALVALGGDPAEPPAANPGARCEHPHAASVEASSSRGPALCLRRQP